jgi:hypothetical protein
MTSRTVLPAALGLALSMSIAASPPRPAPAQTARAPQTAAVPHGSVEGVKVHGKALEGNPEGDSMGEKKMRPSFSTNLAFERGAPAASGTPGAKKGAEPDTSAISKRLAAAVDRGDVPGVVALVVNRDAAGHDSPPAVAHLRSVAAVS